MITAASNIAPAEKAAIAAGRAQRRSRSMTSSRLISTRFAPCSGS